jgi:hypothetical protein
MELSNGSVKYYDSFSIMIINNLGKIRRLYTPFRVVCLDNIDAIYQNSNLYVEEVFEDPDDRLLFKIGGNLYPYWYFSITVSF